MLSHTESRFGRHLHGTVVEGGLREVHHFTGRKSSCMDMRLLPVEPESGSWAILFTGKARASLTQAVKHRFKSKDMEEEPEFGPGTSQMDVTAIISQLRLLPEMRLEAIGFSSWLCQMASE